MINKQPDKQLPKSIVFAAVKGVTIGAAISVLAATCADAIVSSWKVRSLRRPAMERIAELLDGKLTVAVISSIATYELSSTLGHNRVIRERGGMESSGTQFYDR